MLIFAVSMFVCDKCIKGQFNLNLSEWPLFM